MMRSAYGRRVKLMFAIVGVFAVGLVLGPASHAWAVETASSDTQINSTIGVVDTQTLTITSVPYGTTAERLIGALSATDGSDQMYIVADATGAVDASTLLESGDTLAVIAEDSTRQDYAIGVLSASETTVDFPDPALDADVRSAIGMPADQQIYASDLATLTALTADSYGSSGGITNLDGLQCATDLTTLYLGFNDLTDIEPLTGLTNLTTLNLNDNDLADISPLAGLTNLTYLDLEDNNISELHPLNGLTNLTMLLLDWNQITDVNPLYELTNLTYLDLSENQINDIGPLKGLTGLTTLYLWSNKVSDVSPLSELTNLQELYLDHNYITDISSLSGLTNLEGLGLSYNQINDISPVGALTGLTQLSLSDNSITDITTLSRLTHLNGLTLSDNDITDIAPLSGLTSLNDVYLSNNDISNVSPLDGLWNIDTLYLDNNDISEVPSMTAPSRLDWVDLADNHITDISPFVGLSLVYLDLSNNDVSDIRSLSGQLDIGLLYLDHNRVTDITPLSGLTNLQDLTLAYNDLDLNGDSPDMATISTLTANNTGATITYLPQNGGITTIRTTLGSMDNTARTIRVPHGTTAEQLKASLSSTDGSTQTYSVYEADGSTPVTSTLATGDKLGVLSADGSANATYSITLTYALAYTAETGGTITGAASQAVAYGSSGMSVTAVADYGYHFAGWSDGVTTAKRQDTDVRADHAVTADFAINTYTITPIAAAHGTISPPTVQTANYGGSQTFTFKPAAGYHIAAVKADKSSLGATSSYTFTYVTTDHTISATFAWTKLETTMTITSNETTVTRGKTVTFSGTISPNMANGTHVVVQIRKSGSSTWKTLSTRSTYSSKHWSYKYTVPKTHARGTFYVRVRYAGTAKYLPCVSGNRKLVIK